MIVVTAGDIVGFTIAGIVLIVFVSSYAYEGVKSWWNEHCKQPPKK